MMTNRGSRGLALRQIERLYREGTLAGVPDGQLLERYLTLHDELAFEAIVSLHGPMVYGLCRRMLHDPRDVEDAFQATFLVLVRKAAEIRDRTGLSSWLYGVAYRVASRARANTIRRKAREGLTPRLDQAIDPRLPEAPVVDGVLDQELNRLPEKFRAPLVLCYLESRTHEQAAAALRWPVGTVRSRLARGRDLLRDRLRRRGHAPGAAIFGPGLWAPMEVLRRSVPPHLVSATVRLALGLGSHTVFPAGAAVTTALALSQGVLTTMKLTQLKWIGLALLATTVSAGGAAALSFREQQAPTAPATSNSVLENIKLPAQTTETVEKRIKELETRLEQKIDQLLGQRGDTMPPDDRGDPSMRDPFTPTRLSNRSIPDARNRLAGNVWSIRELEVELDQSLDVLAKAMKTHHGDALEPELRDVVRAAARLEGVEADLGDELARLKLQMRRKLAELDREKAMREGVSVRAAGIARLKNQNVISADEVAKSDTEEKVAEAQVEMKKVEVEEVALQIEQLTRRRDRAAELIKRAERARAAVEASH